jgi:hypothetical protein
MRDIVRPSLVAFYIRVLKVHNHEILLKLFYRKPNFYGHKGLQHEIFENHIRFGRDIQLLNIFALAECVQKPFPHWLSQGWNTFPVCSASDGL